MLFVDFGQINYYLLRGLMLSGDLMAIFIFLLCGGFSIFTFKDFQAQLDEEVKRRSPSDLPKIKLALIMTIILLDTLIFAVFYYLPYEVAVNYIKVCTEHSRRCLPVHGLGIWLGAAGICIFLMTTIVFGIMKIKALANKKE